MRPLIAALILVSCCASLPAQAFNPNRKVDGHDDAAGRTMYNRGRMPELPSGPNKLHCWIVVSDNWLNNPLEHDLAAHIKSDPRMQQIKAGTYFNYYTVSNPKFAQSGLVSAVGTATPILVVTQGDGGIQADGSGGLFVNAQSCPKTADEIVDLLCDAIEAANPPPIVEGQTTATAIVREDCPDGNCPPVPAPQPMVTPNGGGTLTPVKPRPKLGGPEIVLAIFAFSAIVIGGILIGVYTPGKKT